MEQMLFFSRTASVFPKTYTIKQVRKVFGSVTLLINANQTLYFPGKRPELQRKGKVWAQAAKKDSWTGEGAGAWRPGKII